jgi:hypothetical protein
MRWYMAEYSGLTENEYEQFASDADAIAGFTSNIPEGEELAEIFRCADDECLTPEDHPLWH